ncbi:uncharacterized protein FFB20_05790 [Fusarium fujikuroi]|nr:uncharacterized protein FFB20_05790 [Fusarium fujikuroi]SCO10753.1 uncharacterized protein FFC1_11197 [Fusarium fujikuroi]SCO13247.1 uncharacterized protein FFE2_12707 [Fusarium fujikuroi]SCO17680.1 uncharacterized protein FFM5_11627 [Fusarium fujikuroi]SCO41117.1 uncharacterized protein FFNC_07879 [Fusarium fujikuroi]
MILARSNSFTFASRPEDPISVYDARGHTECEAGIDMHEKPVLHSGHCA